MLLCSMTAVDSSGKKILLFRNLIVEKNSVRHLIA